MCTQALSTVAKEIQNTNRLIARYFVGLQKVAIGTLNKYVLLGI